MEGNNLVLAREVYWIIVPSFRESRWPLASQRFALFGFAEDRIESTAIDDDRLHKQSSAPLVRKYADKYEL